MSEIESVSESVREEGMKGLRLGILERLVGQATEDPGQHVREVVEMARSAERHGYSRFWLAEHHARGTMCATPEILLPLVLSKTTTLVVGSGGLVLPLHTPLRAVESFLALESLFPNRVELGVCRGPGIADDRTAKEFDVSATVQNIHELFEPKLERLLKLLYTRVGDSSDPMPATVAAPYLVLIGGTLRGVAAAARFGLPIAFSLMHSRQLDFRERSKLIRIYRETFNRSTRGNEPHVILAISVICGSTTKAARQRAAAMAPQLPFDVPVIGSPWQCARRIHDLAKKFHAREVVLMSWEPTIAMRRLTFECIAEAFWDTDAS